MSRLGVQAIELYDRHKEQRLLTRTSMRKVDELSAQIESQMERMSSAADRSMAASIQNSKESVANVRTLLLTLTLPGYCPCPVKT